MIYSAVFLILSAAVTAATCVNISTQYASFSTIPRIPRTCPSMRLRRFIRSLYSFSSRFFFRSQHVQSHLHAFIFSSKFASSFIFRYPHPVFRITIIYPNRVSVNPRKNQYLFKRKRTICFYRLFFFKFFIFPHCYLIIDRQSCTALQL